MEATPHQICCQTWSILPSQHFLYLPILFQAHWHHSMQTFNSWATGLSKSPYPSFFLSNSFSHFIKLSVSFFLISSLTCKAHLPCSYPRSHFLHLPVHIHSRTEQLTVSVPHLLTSVQVLKYVLFPPSGMSFYISVHSTPSPNLESVSHLCSVRLYLMSPPARNLARFH